MTMLGFTEREAWKKTPYQIITLFGYHKEYNPHIFRTRLTGSQSGLAKEGAMDDIDMALGGL